MPHVHIYNKVFDKVPCMNELQNLSFLFVREKNINTINLKKNFLMYELGFCSLERSRSFKKENLHYIGNKEINKKIYMDVVEFEKKYNYLIADEVYWHFFDRRIILYFKINKKYKN